MPYIKEERRREFHRTLGAAQDVGELNYQITCLINKYMFVKGESYQTYNDIMGALEGAKLELYRRKIAPYEDKKCEENGDVYSILRVTPLAKGINWEGTDRANKLSKSKRQKTSAMGA